MSEEIVGTSSRPSPEQQLRDLRKLLVGLRFGIVGLAGMHPIPIPASLRPKVEKGVLTLCYLFTEKRLKVPEELSVIVARELLDMYQYDTIPKKVRDALKLAINTVAPDSIL